MRKIAVVLLLLISTNANAWCESQTQVAEIKYRVNSSFFGLLATQQLDKLLISNDQANTAVGYLMLEYRLDTNETTTITDPKAKIERENYNRWLAERRIKRVKDYLTSKQLQSPILTRISTATKEATRSVYLHWCQTTSEPAAFKVLAAD